jgi:hypothetical protein
MCRLAGCGLDGEGLNPEFVESVLHNMATKEHGVREDDGSKDVKRSRDNEYGGIGYNQSAGAKKRKGNVKETLGDGRLPPYQTSSASLGHQRQLSGSSNYSPIVPSPLSGHSDSSVESRLSSTHASQLNNKIFPRKTSTPSVSSALPLSAGHEESMSVKRSSIYSVVNTTEDPSNNINRSFRDTNPFQSLEAYYQHNNASTYSSHIHTHMQNNPYPPPYAYGPPPPPMSSSSSQAPYPPLGSPQLHAYAPYYYPPPHMPYYYYPPAPAPGIPPAPWPGAYYYGSSDRDADAVTKGKEEIERM